ncbi:MAG: hypothetical protein JXX28_17260 [Deltaproteobacteria bacterium]|nr:hypothetical protein [Deltaproteobacteria bacterium]
MGRPPYGAERATSWSNGQRHLELFDNEDVVGEVRRFRSGLIEYVNTEDRWGCDCSGGGRIYRDGMYYQRWRSCACSDGNDPYPTDSEYRWTCP